MYTARPNLDPSAPARNAGVDRAEVGVCSTRPSLTADTPHAGVDTLRLLFDTHAFVDGPRPVELLGLDGWRVGSIPALGLTWAEGHPTPGALASGSEVATAAATVRDVVDQHLGVMRDRGVARSDQTVNLPFNRPQDTRAFLAGMAATHLPRCETTRRGHPVHSISWTHATGRRILARCYDKGMEQGGEAFKFGRLEDQRRYSSGHRPSVEDVADPEYLRERFVSRFGPIRKAVDGVKAATFPVIAQALADEARYGYRDWREAERLAGALVLLSGGGAEAYSRPTYYRRKAELREAGYVVVDDLAEVVEVNLAECVDAAMESDAWA
jgi:hypothetical protein